MDKAVKYGQESLLDDAEDDVNGVDEDLTSLGKQHYKVIKEIFRPQAFSGRSGTRVWLVRDGVMCELKESWIPANYPSEYCSPCRR